MARQLKTEAVGLRLTPQLNKDLVKASEHYGVSKSYIINESIKLFLRNVLN